MSVDFRIYYEGALIGIRPCNEEAGVWIDENLHWEPWQWLGGVLWIDRRYLEKILDGMHEEGLTFNDA